SGTGTPWPFARAISPRAGRPTGRHARSSHRTEPKESPMPRKRPLVLLAAGTLVASGMCLARSLAEGPRHPAPVSPSGNTVVTLCDGKTTAEIPGVKEGEQPTRAQAED